MPNPSAILVSVSLALAVGARAGIADTASASWPARSGIGSPPPPATKSRPEPEVVGVPMELKPAAPRSLWCDNVVEMETSRRSGVTSAWLSNGVRVHHLKLDRRPGEVVVTIALSGGKLLEDATTRGITEVAAGVLDDWDTAAPEQSAREKMQGRDLRIDAGASQDALTVRLAGAVTDLDAGLRVVHALLTNPKVTEESVRQSKEKVIRELRQREGDARAAVSDAINIALLGPAGREGAGRGVDPRLEAPREQAVQAISIEQIRGWISRHIKEDGAPIEVAFVGDLTLADALRMADGTLGTLPKRARVDAQTDGAARVVARAPLPMGGASGAAESAGVSPGRVTLVRGCFGPEMSELDDQRCLRAAARVAVSRLKARLVPPRFTIGQNDPGGGVYVSAFRGLGMALVTATVEAGQAPEATREIDEELDRLAQTPPSAAELEPICRDLATSVEEFEHDPRYWSEALARCDAIGITPDDIASGSVFYKSLKPEQVRDAMKKYRVKDRLIGLTIRGPARAASPEPALK